MTKLDKLIQEAQVLPYFEKQKLIKALQVNTSFDISSPKIAAIRKARGSMKEILPTIEEFLAEKHAELEREQRSSRV